MTALFAVLILLLLAFIWITLSRIADALEAQTRIYTSYLESQETPFGRLEDAA